MKNRKLSRKGMGHLEIILSFVMFVGFVMALFLAFPITKTNKKGISIDALERAVENYSKMSVTYVSFALKEGNVEPKKCFYISFNVPLPNNFMVKKENGETTEAVMSGTDLYVDKLNPAPNPSSLTDNNDFYTIYYSPIINTIPFSPNNCHNTGTGNYIIGLRRNYTGYFEPRIVELETIYADSAKYAQLKKDWGIPAGNNFNIIFSEYNTVAGKFVAKNTLTREKTPSSGIYAKEVPIVVLDNAGQVAHWMMRLEEW